MRLGKRILTSLLASTLLSAVLYLLEIATASKALFDLQFPGFYACVLIWGVHSSPDNPAVGLMVFVATNALAYWPLCLGLSFLFRKRSAKPRPIKTD